MQAMSTLIHIQSIIETQQSLSYPINIEHSI